VNEIAPLSFGQLSVWRDVRELSQDRWHEANTRSVWMLPEDAETSVTDVEAAVRSLGRGHESLRTVYGLEDPLAPTQRVLPFGAAEVESGVAEIGAADEVEDLIGQLAARAFDLSREPSWRFRVLTRGGRPMAVATVRHHITADGWSDTILEKDFHTALGSPTATGAAPPPSPRELAEWQRTAGGNARHAKLLAYWEKIFDLDAAALGSVGPVVPADTARQCFIRSRSALARTRRLSEMLSVPVSSVVLAAFARSVAQVAGSGTVTAQLMSSNRFVPAWGSLVSSMNQWTATSLEVPDVPDSQDGPDAADGPDGRRATLVDGLAPFAAKVHTQSMLAYRHGMYDVDEVDALRAKVRSGRDPYEASLAFNFLTGTPPPAGAAAEPEGEAVWETPFSRIGHPCYLRAGDAGGTALELRLRTLGLPEAVTRDVLEGTIAQLSDLPA
jgi:hypothetical protein